MATNNILNIPQWILTGSVSIPDAGFSKIYPKKGETSSWYIVDEANSEKRLALDYLIGAGLSQSTTPIDSKYGYRLDVLIGPGLTYASGPIQNAAISVAGLTPSMLAITGSFTYGYVLSTSTYSGEFTWIPNSSNNIVGDFNRVAKFSGVNSLTSSLITDNGVNVYIGSTPSTPGVSFSVDGFVNVGSSGTGSRLYFGDAQNHYIEKQYDNGFIIRTEDEFRVDHYTNSETTYKVIDFDFLGNENRTLGLMDNLVQVINYTSSSYISASNVNFVRFGKTQSSFQLELISGSQGAIKIQDGGQASYSVLYSDSQGIGKWGQIYGYNGLTTSALGIGLNLTNIAGLTYSGGTFGLDYTKFVAPISVSDTFTVSLATVSVTTGLTYGSMFETPTFRVDQFGRIIGVGTVSTMAFTGPQGPTGTSFVWQGSYTQSLTYSLYNVVEYDGSSYISLGTASPGLTPSSVTQSWNLLASKGASGTQGPTGTSFIWQGAYATVSSYNLYDVVRYDGSSYISITTSNAGSTPSTATMSWDLMAAGSTATGGMELIAGTFGDIMVYGNYGWTALGLGPSGSYLYSLGTESNQLPIWVTQSPGLILTQDYTVNLTTGKNFGRYNPGDVIPSGTQGWSIEKFIFMVLNENLKPTVILNIDEPSAISFGTDTINFNLAYSYTIRNVLENGDQAEFASGKLEFTQDIDNGPFVELFDTTYPIGDPLAPANPFLYNYDDPFDNYQGIYYFKYTVTDTKGDSNYAIDQIDVTDYVPPSISLNVSGTNIITERGETHILRERGNVRSNISGSATRQSALINLDTYSLQWRVNSLGSFNALDSGSFVSGVGGSIANVLHSKTEPLNLEADVNATSLNYRLQVNDVTIPPRTTTSATITVNFEPMIYFGPVTNEAWISGVSGITRDNLFGFATLQNGGTEAAGASPFYKLQLESIGISSSNKIIFRSGETARIFIVAIPNTYTISTAEKVNATSGRSTITDKYSYMETIDLLNYDGVTTTRYKIFCHTQSVPYTLEGVNTTTIEITLT